MNVYNKKKPFEDKFGETQKKSNERDSYRR